MCKVDVEFQARAGFDNNLNLFDYREPLEVEDFLPKGPVEPFPLGF
jgi:hypothetical protein